MIRLGAESEQNRKGSTVVKKFFAALSLFLTLTLTLTGCDVAQKWGEDFARTWRGVHATMTTYNEESQVIDQVKGSSFQITRDETFDTTTTNEDGTSKSEKDSQVLKITVGDKQINHVGSTLILAEDGLADIMSQSNQKIEITNSDRGTPWLNRMLRSTTDLWKGKSRIIMIRSQNGTPLAVYAGNSVTIHKTDVPKSTQFRVDGKYLFVYRADYTIYDSALLK